jgi:hypothetical protein
MICKKYAKVVDQWAPLESLGVSDRPLLREATETYLFGFYRATVILSAAVVEDLLKQLTDTPLDERCKYPALVERAVKLGILNTRDQNALNDLLSFRNDVVHQNLTPSADQALAWLSQSRALVNTLIGNDET